MKTFDINLAKTMTRFEFITQWVAYQTRTKEGRWYVSGLQVKKVRGGWVYGFATSEGWSCQPTTVDKLYDMIRRTDLNYHVNVAEHIRIDVLTGARTVKFV